ncbi:MAG: GIY-YIG nuclease family protein [Deltaproteobacteria bacterium]|nr:GIY-YIG nuclease family protein [Myxococcales bacterium]MDP3214636.1 GIY-YIG nuclease family protein [Deltaproteobacteria bacterium]
MDPSFASLIESLEPKCIALLTMSPVKYRSLSPPLPNRGIYLFSEGDRHLYVGRTNRLRQRLAGHCLPSASHFTATFAFRLARESTGRLKATYKKEGSRAALLEDLAFKTAFTAGKARVAGLDLRYVEEMDPTRQAVLEIYVATVLGTPYNDFENH